MTGVTVLRFDEGAKAGCDISGGGPASREMTSLYFLLPLIMLEKHLFFWWICFCPIIPLMPLFF